MQGMWKMSGCLSGKLDRARRRQKAVIRYPKDCWGCASCIKECPFEAISYYLGADIGGMGSQMTVHTEGDLLHWRIKKTDGTIETIVVNKKDSNKY